MTKHLSLFLGDVGGWKDYFSVKQSEEIDAQVEEKLGQNEY